MHLVVLVELCICVAEVCSFECIEMCRTCMSALQRATLTSGPAGSPSTRLATVAFSAGTGLGSAYSDASRLFEGKPSTSTSRPAVVRATTVLNCAQNGRFSGDILLPDSFD